MTTMEKYQELVRWMIDNSIELSSSLKVAPSNLGGYGVFAKKQIPADTVLLSVNKKQVLSPPTCGIANLLEEHEIDGMIGLTLAYMFERAQGKNSPWYYYLQTIEEEPSPGSLPRFWTSEQQEWLKGTEIEYMGGIDESEVSDVYEDMIKPFISAYSHMFEAVPIYQTYEGYKNSLMAVCSRAFEVDTFRGLSLVPGACLFNHSDSEHVHFETADQVCNSCGALDFCEHMAGDAGSESDEDEETEENEDDYGYEDISDDDDEETSCEIEDEMVPELFDEDPQEPDNQEDDDDDEDDTCDIRTITNVSEGSEIFNSYGELSNGVLLSRYGFAIWDNTSETISLAKEIHHTASTSEDLNKRLKWWKKNYFRCIFGISPDEYDEERDLEHAPHPESLTWQETAEILSHGEPTDGLRMLLNILSMSSKKYLVMTTRAKSGNFSQVPAGRDGSRLWKELVKQRMNRYKDGKMTSKDYQKLLKEIPIDHDEQNVRKRLAVTTRGTEKLVLERALAYKY